ncbi:MAG: DUF502 domain-containing protein [Gammaproteobacteria bacterium]
MVRFISKNLITGLITMLPIVLTVYLFYWFAISTEAVLGHLIQLVLPDEMYRPGMGIVIGFIGVFFVGLLMNLYIVRWVFGIGERILYRMPLIKSVYSAIRDFFNYFSPQSKKQFEQVVSVEIGNTGMQVIGFVTQAESDKLPVDFQEGDNILVYIPISYMIGGYAVFMPRSAVRPLKMNMEDAMRFALTAGVTGVTPAAKESV